MTTVTECLLAALVDHHLKSPLPIRRIYVGTDLFPRLKAEVDALPDPLAHVKLRWVGSQLLLGDIPVVMGTSLVQPSEVGLELGPPQ